MRGLLGGLVLVAGVGGLGWYGSSNTAKDIETGIDAAAQDIVAQAPFGVTADVSGRDIHVRGTVADAAEAEALLAALNDVDGRRVVRMDDLAFLPRAEPFELTATKGTDGWTGLSGAIPSEDVRATMATATGLDAGALVLSTGAPDANWPVALMIGAEAAGPLESASLTLSDTVLTLTGTALTPAQKDAAEAVLAGLPGGYTSTTDIAALDDGTPFRLEATWEGSTLLATGKVPAEVMGMTLADDSPVETLRFRATRSVLSDESWPSVMQSSVDALLLLQSGDLSIEGETVTLSGVALPDAKAEAEAMIAGLPGGYAGSTDIALYDDGAPFSLLVGYDGSAATVAGKLPAGVARDDLNAAFPQAPLEGETDSAFIGDPDGTWFTTTQDALAALGMLDSGELSVVGEKVTLSGVALSPAVEADITALLAGVDADLSLEFLDDGTPPDWHLRYEAATGATLNGKLPAGLTKGDLADLIALPAIDGTPDQGFIEAESDEVLSALSMAAEYLPETELLDLDLSGERPTLELVMSPGVDTELVALDLSQRLPGSIDFFISDLEDMPREGDTRLNIALNQQEEFTGGTWLPQLDFIADLETCRDEAASVLSGGGVNFLSGEARLDAKSVRAINTVAAIVMKCVNEAGLALEVGGHTDNTGDDALNQTLSDARAQTVRDALVARGIDDLAISAVGYGSSQPIADNATEEGRAANRRTELTWSALPDPEPEPEPTQDAAETGE